MTNMQTRAVRTGIKAVVAVAVAAGMLTTTSGPRALAQCETDKVTPNDIGASDRFGWSSAMSGDYVVVGADLGDVDMDLQNTGVVYVYLRNGLELVEMQRLSASDADADPDRFGASVAIDGDLILVGAPNENEFGGPFAGAAYIFRRSGSLWIEEAKIGASDAAALDQFGAAVAIAGDIAVVGAPSNDVLMNGENQTDHGAAYVFTRFDNTFPCNGDLDCDLVGLSTCSGNMCQGVTWAEEQRLLPPDGSAGDFFGGAVAISGDRIIVGSKNDDDACTMNPSCSSGSVYVFRDDGTDWSLDAKLTASDAAPADGFGEAVSIDGDVAAITALGRDDGALNAGAAYVFRRNGTDWIEEAKLLASDPAASDRFGRSVSIDDDLILVGTRDTDDAGFRSGSAYLFRFDGTNWTQVAKLRALDEATNDRFGQSVALAGNHAVIGAYLNDVRGTDSGSAYLFLVGLAQDCNRNDNPDECDLFACDGSPACMDVSPADGVPDGCQCSASDPECFDDRPCATVSCDLDIERCVVEPVADTCLVEGTCIDEGAVNPNNMCQACDPTIDPFGWSARTDATLCDDGLSCTVDRCGLDRCMHELIPTSCLIDGECFMGVNPANGCEICDVVSDPLTWTARPDGTACPDDGSDCTDDVCMAGSCMHQHVAGSTPCILPTIIDLNVPFGTESTPVTRVLGDDAHDHLGSALSGLAFGDVNGDGFDDMIIGAPDADPPGGPLGGEVYVIYGGASPSGPSVDLNTANGANGETRILGDDAVDGVGWSVACGDVNGDGYDDVIAGAPFVDPLNGFGAGEVYVIFGGAALPGTTVDLNSAVGSNGEARILGAGGQAGWSVASGDIDSDGFDDVIIGAYVADTPGGSLAGVAYVIYGSALLPGTTVDLFTAAGSNDGTLILGDDFADRAGWSVASGDVNGDGYDDVIIGAPYADPPGGNRAGEVYVIYGSASLPGSTVDLSSTPGANGETRILGNDVSGRVGFSVASGDVDGDGFDDVIIGAKSVGAFGAGRVYVVYGITSLPGTTVDLNSSPGSNGETRILGDGLGIEAGQSVAAGDIDGDGFDDVILGARLADPPVGRDAGEAYVIFGSASLRGTIVDLNSAPGSNGETRVLGDSAGDRLGQATTAGGDVDRDGLADFTVSSVRGDNPSIGGDNDSGTVALVFGAGLAASATVIERDQAGDAPPRGFGGRLTPVVRTIIDYDSGDSGVSTTMVTLHRSAPDTPPDLATVLPVHWEITTDRTGFTADLTLQYTDAELGAASEGDLKVFRSATGASGTWSLAGTFQSINTTRNEITVVGLTGFAFFAIVESPTALLSSTPAHDSTLPRVSGNCVELQFAADVTPENAGSIMINQLLAGGELGSVDLAPLFSFTVDGDIVRIQDQFDVLGNETWYRFHNDSGGASLAPFAVDLAVVFGDVNQSGQTDVTDVTRVLANRGDPAPACSRFDLNGSGAVDVTDVTRALAERGSTAPPKP